MKVLFMGTPAFAAASLERIHDAGHECVGVVTRPDAPAGRGLRTRTSAVKDLALARGLKVLQPAALRGEPGAAFMKECAALSPEITVVAAYGRILPQRLLDLAPRGAVNVHASLLPKYRGAAPIAWAIARGEDRTGCTTMRMIAELDAGDILMQEEVPIRADDTTGTLEKRLASLGADLIVRTIEGIGAGSLVPIPQDAALATWAPMISRQDGRVDWNDEAAAIERRVRAFDPWPGVWTVTPSGREIRIRSSLVMGNPPRPAPEPGTVIGEGAEAGMDGVAVACGSGSAILMVEVQPAGGRRMTARQAISGRHLVRGERLG